MLQIQGFDLEEGDHRVEMEKVATLPFHQDQSDLQSNSLEVKQAVLNDGKIINMDVTNPRSDLPVLYYSKPGQDQDVIKTLALEAAKCGVPALIVTRDPGMPHNIPVFVFDEDEMRELMNFYSVSIVISVKGKSPDNSYEDDATFVSHPARPSYSNVTSRVDEEVEVTNSSPGHKESRGFIGTMFKSFKNYVYTPKVKSVLKGVLQEWSEDSVESYGSAMRLLQLAKYSESNYDAENGEIRKQLLEYMNDHDYSVGILLLAFCCEFLLCAPVDHKKKLRPAIAKRILLLDTHSPFDLNYIVKGLNCSDPSPADRWCGLLIANSIS